MPVEKNDEGEEQRVQFPEAGQDLKEKEEKKDEDEAEEEVKLNEAEEEEDKEDGEGDAEEDDEEEEEDAEEEEDEDADEEEERKDSPDSNSGDESDQYMEIDLEDILREVQCPICLGIIKKTRTMMECLHRFCRECIEKSLRLGNNECPACRAHCPSRRSLRDDLNFDKFIATLFPNIDSFEEEELNEEEKASNKEIQESIAQVSERRKRKRGSTRHGTEEELRNKKK